MKNIRNAIVMMFDSWQHNYTGCYGNSWIKTPNIDRFAKEGVLFEQAYGENMPTLPVRRAMMTGRYTLHEIGWAPLRPEDTTIADLCWGTGVDTAMAYNSLVLFMDKAGFARSYAKAIFSRGFDNFHFVCDELYHYTVDQFFTDEGFIDRLRALPDGKELEAMCKSEYDGYLRDKQYWTSEEKHTVAVNIAEAIKLIEGRDKTHSFHLWIDCWDPHEPWDPPSVWDKDMPCPYDPDYKGADLWLPPMSPVKDLYTEPQMNHVRMLFAEKITLCDKYFGKLCDCIRKEGMWENTLLWLTSDHGEPLGNGEHGHGLMTKCRPWPYEELVHIPLIIRAPGLPAGKRIKAFVQDCDCAPTVLDWLGINIPQNMTGKSLLPLCRGEVSKVRDFAIAGYYNFSWSIITEDWSYIHWLDKLENDAVGSALGKMYAADLMQNDLSESMGTDADAIAEYRKQRALDSEAQWTCTPGSKVEVPHGDELYDHKKDPFQLHNVIDTHPKVAEELLRKLRLFMSDLKAQ